MIRSYKTIALKNHITEWKVCCIAVFAATLLSGCHGQNELNKVTITMDGAWCWFQDPRAVYINGEHERTYAQWMTSEGKLQVGAYGHKSGKIETHTLKENWDRDDHNVGAFLILPDNRLMVFYARHNKTGIFCRTTVNPEDIHNWNEEVAVCMSEFITYAHPVYLSEENRIYVFWRGLTWKPTFATSQDGISWSEPRVLIQDEGKESNKIRPYTKITSDGRSSIHVAFTDGHPAQEKQNSVYYLKYEKDQFFRADGSIIGTMDNLPVQHNQSDVIYDCTVSGILSWVWDIALDEEGYPVVAYTRFPKTTDHRYHYARWDGKEWVDVQLIPVAGGSLKPRKGKKKESCTILPALPSILRIHPDYTCPAR